MGVSQEQIDQAIARRQAETQAQGPTLADGTQAVQPSTPQTQTSAPLNQTVGDALVKGGMSIAGAVVNPVIDLANVALKNVGGNEKTKGNLGMSIQNAVKGTTKTVASPEAGRVAAETASFAVPYGKAGFIGSKFIAPGAAQGVLQGVSQGDTPEKLVGDAAIGAAAGAGIQAASTAIPAISKATKNLVTKGADEGSKALALKGLKPTPSQQNKFFNETGDKLDEFLTKRNLAGADANQIDAHIAPIQEQFDSVASNPELKISGKSVVQGFDDQIKKLSDSVLPSDKTKAQTLQNIRDNFIEKYGQGTIGADALTALRRDVDAGIKDFNLDPAVKSPLNRVRDILQNSIRDSADKAGITIEGSSLKDLGKELSKLYKLQTIAQRQQFTGQSTSPIGLRNLLGATVGGATGGLPGAAAGMIGTAVANSPKVINTASKGLGGISTIAEKIPTIPELGAKGNYIAGQTAVRTALKPLNVQTSNPSDQGNNNQIDHSGSDYNTNPVKNQVSYVTGRSPEEHAQAYIAALQAGDKAAASQIKTLYEMETKYQADNKANGGKPLPVAAQTQVNLAKSGTRGLDEAEKLYTEDPGVLTKQLIPGQWVSRQFDSAMFRTVEALLRSRSGAAVPEQEVRRYLDKYGPRFGDSADVVKFKFNQLRQDFNDVLQGAGNTAGSGMQFSDGTPAFAQ